MILFCLCVVAMLKTVVNEKSVSDGSSRERRHTVNIMIQSNAGEIVDENPFYKQSSGHSYNEANISECTMKLTSPTSSDFDSLFKENHVNFIELVLHFSQDIGSTELTILPNRWVWTYKGGRGAYQYLYMPYEAQEWSLRTLSFYRRNMNVYINASEGCLGHAIGQPDTNKLIGQAFRDMIRNTSLKYAQYICVLVRSSATDLFKDSMYSVFLLGSQFTTQYNCCIIVPADNVSINCTITMATSFGYWYATYLLGIILFVYYPLLLMFLVSKIHMAYTAVKKDDKCFPRHFARHSDSFTHNDDLTVFNGPSEKNHRDSNAIASVSEETSILRVMPESLTTQELMFFTDVAPFGVLSTIMSPLRKCFPRGPIASRFVRFLFPALTLSVVTVELVNDAICMKEYVVAATKAEVPLGFRTMVAGYNASSDRYLVWFGGPYIALSCYIVLWWLLLVLPEDLSALFELGVPRPNESVKSPLMLSLEKKEELGSCNIRGHSGYFKIYRLLLAHFQMVFNPSFWNASIHIMVTRFKTTVCQNICLQDRLWFRLPVSFGLLLLYVPVCIVEQFICLLYYGVPVFGFARIAFVAETNYVVRFIRGKISGRKGKVLSCLAPIVPIMISSYEMFICFSIYMETFLYLSRVIVYTYAGTIAFPHKSYGWLILVFTALYYSAESMGRFSDAYHRLLRETIEICDKNARKNKHLPCLVYELDNSKGIPKELFLLIVKRIQPRHIQIVYIVIRLAVTFLICSFSINLLVKFNRRENVTLITHVFMALFICTLPKLLASAFNRKTGPSGSIKHRLVITEVVNEYIYIRQV